MNIGGKTELFADIYELYFRILFIILNRIHINLKCA